MYYLFTNRYHRFRISVLRIHRRYKIYNRKQNRLQVLNNFFKPTFNINASSICLYSFFFFCFNFGQLNSFIFIYFFSLLFILLLYKGSFLHQHFYIYSLKDAHYIIDMKVRPTVSRIFFFFFIYIALFFYVIIYNFFHRVTQYNDFFYIIIQIVLICLA